MAGSSRSGDGSAPGQLNGPAQIALDGWGNLVVADSGNDRVQVFGASAVPATPVSWGRLRRIYR